MTWNDTFLALYDRCLSLYQTGNHDFENYYTQKDLSFLASIGCQPREFFDFIEDFAEEQEPSQSTALLVAAVRRDYFLVAQGGKPSAQRLTRDELPTFGDTLDEISYLPRLLTKAKAKLRGELDPDIMYGCGGDRKFLKDHGDLHPADFLRHVWAAEGDDSRIVSLVKG